MAEVSDKDNVTYSSVMCQQLTFVSWCCRGSLSRTPHYGSAVGTSPERQAVSGAWGWWVVNMMQRSDWHLPATSNVSAMPETGACLHVWIHYPFKSTNTSHCKTCTTFIFSCGAPRGTGLRPSHKATCSHWVICKFSTRWSYSSTESPDWSERSHQSFRVRPVNVGKKVALLSGVWCQYPCLSLFSLLE